MSYYENQSSIKKLGYYYYQEIVQRYYKKLYDKKGVSFTACTINFDKINITLSKTCDLEISNNCTQNAETSIKLLLESLYEVLLMMNENDRNKVLKILKIDIKDLEDIDNSSLIEGFGACSSYAKTIATIDVDKIQVDRCYGESVNNKNHLFFINTGSANSNCNLSTISNALVFDEDEDEILKTYKIDKILGLDSIKVFIYILILICLFIFIFIFCVIEFFKYTIIYRSCNDIIYKDKPLLFGFKIRDLPFNIINRNN